MSRVSTVVFCGNASIENVGQKDQSINCIGVLSQGGVPAVPSLLSISMLVMIDIENLPPVETISIRIESPDKEVIFDQSLDVDPSKLPDFPDANSMSLAMNIQNLVIRTTGVYSFYFSINGVLDSSKNLKVSLKDF